MQLKSASFTKSGPGRRHVEPKAGKRRNDKEGTTKLSRALSNQRGYAMKFRNAQSAS